MAESDDDLVPFMLAAIGAHQADVKCIAAGDAEGATLITASRDQLVAKWTIPRNEGDGDTLQQALAFAGHQGFVNFVMFHPSIPFLGGDPGIISGSNDKHVIVWNPETSFIEAVLDGHGGVVRCGCVLASGDFATGSWDSTCVVWDAHRGHPRALSTAHTNAVLGIAALDERSEVLSASGDKTIRRWSATDGALRATYTFHTDSVQAVCVVSSDRFFSAGNDALIVLWDVDSATPLRQLAGHDSFIYALAFSRAHDTLYSASEDSTVRVWRGAADISQSPRVAQVLHHPCLVWTACPLPNGDLASGGADGQVRVWTRDVGRLASQDKIDALEAAVAARQLPAAAAATAGGGGGAGGGGLDVSKLKPVDEALRTRGTHEGEKMFARAPSGDVDAFSWCGGRWDKIGTVVMDGAGASSAKPKAVLNGQEFDYVFNIDFHGTALQLGYNSGGNVFDAAQNFINDHAHLGVSQMDKEAIEQHILNNISPEDVQKVTGMAAATATTASTGASDGCGAFSEYAREMEELRRRGESGGMSFKEAMQKMEAEGATDVAFSTFAREGRALAGGGGATPPTTTASPRDDGAGAPGDRTPAPQRFSGLNTEGLMRKLGELLGADAAGRFEEPVRAAAAVGAALSFEGAVTADDAARSVDASLELLDLLPPGSRFVAVDIARAVLCNGEAARGAVPTHFPTLMPRVAALVLESNTDAERLVSLRCLANAVQASAALAAQVLVSSSTVSSTEGEQQQGAATALAPVVEALPALIRGNASGAVKAAAASLLTNATLVAVGVLHSDTTASTGGGGAATAMLGGAALRCAIAEAVITASGQALLYVRDDVLLSKLLESTLLLVTHAGRVCPELEAHVVRCGRRLMYTSLLPRRDVGDPVIRAVAAHLSAAFAPPVEE